MSNASLIKLDKNYIEKVSILLSDSFDDNPLILYFFEDEHLRKKILPKIFQIVVKSMMIMGDVYAASENLEGVIGLRIPNKAKTDFSLYLELIKNISINLPTLRYFLSKKTISKIKNMNISGYPKEYNNYFTIEMVAVDKKYRGQKIMSKMVKFCLAKVNTHNSICLLQTETDINCSKYQHLGFTLLQNCEVVKNKLYSYTLIYDSNRTVSNSID